MIEKIVFTWLAAIVPLAIYGYYERHPGKGVSLRWKLAIAWSCCGFIILIFIKLMR